MRFFVAEGLRQAAVGMEIVDATPVTAGRRMFKTKAEIALMQRANDVTIEAYRAGLNTLREDGCNVLEKIDHSEYGKFGWVIGPEENKVELWQPPAGQ